ARARAGRRPATTPRRPRPRTGRSPTPWSAGVPRGPASTSVRGRRRPRRGARPLLSEAGLVGAHEDALALLAPDHLVGVRSADPAELGGVEGHVAAAALAGAQERGAD